MSRPDENKNEHPVVHPIPPVYRADSRILILGSFPSVKSRETGFFYGHPQNRFWKVTAAVCGEEVPQTVEEKKAFLLRNHIAVWDVIASCVITGSSDASIRDVVPNPLQDILECADIRQIYCNGATAWKYYRKYQEKQLGREAVRLPSTSPANAAWSVERLLGEWSQCFIGKSRSDDTVRNLTFDQRCGVFVADIRKCDKVAERRHTVCASGSCISAC